MKLLFKILAYTFFILLGLVLALFLIAELAENKVTSIALDQINDGVEANITVHDVDFSLLKDFPYATVELQDVVISTPHDTLAHVNHIFVAVETMPLLDSQFKIKEVTVEGGHANYHINKDGSTNFDVFLAVPEEQESDTTSQSLYLLLEKLRLNQLFCSYKDQSNDIQACLYVDEADANVQINDLNKIAAFNGTIRANSCHYPSSNLMLMEETKINMDVAYNNDSIALHSVDIETDGAKIKASGYVKQGASIETDIHISSSQFDFKVLKKYIPDSLLQAYDIKQIAGIANAQVHINGLYNDSTMPLIDATFQLHDGHIEMANYPVVKHIQLSAKYNNGHLHNNETTTLDVDTFKFTSRLSNGFIAASIANLDNIKYAINSKLNLNLQELMDHMPDSTIEDMNGELALQFSTHGQLPEKFDDAFINYLLAKSTLKAELKNINAKVDTSLSLQNWNGRFDYKNKQFSISNLGVKLPNYPLTLQNTSLSGNFNGSIFDLKKLSIQLSAFDISTASSQLSGTAHIRNLEYPSYAIQANSRINLAEFKPFTPTSLVKDMSGTIKTALHSEGTLNLDSIADQAMDILFNATGINTRFEKVNIKLKDPSINILDLGGQLTLNADSLRMNNINGSFNKMTFATDSVQISNIYKAYWLNQADTIKVDGNLHFGDIDFTMFAPFMAEETSSETEETEPTEPSKYRLEAKGKVTAKSFNYENALLKNISTLYNITDSLYIIDQFKFDGFKGSMNSSLRYEVLPKMAVLKFRNKTNKLDINQLLYDFDDFIAYTEETYISHNQLKGLLSADMDLSLNFIEDTLDLNSLMMKGDLLLEEGRLSDYDIAVEMGNEYNIEELADLKFKTIETKMFIYQGSAYVPQTNIKSNAFDITIFGMQEFNMDCEYYLRLYFKELIRKGKTKTITKKQSKEKKVKNDGGTKGMISIYPFYEIKNGIDNMGTRGNNNSERKSMKMKILLQQTGLPVSFNPTDFNYETGVKDD